MPNAARLGDPIGHSPTMSWLLTGLLIGAGIAIAAVAIVGTGGLAAAAIVGGAAAAGAGLGEFLSTMSWAPKDVVGEIISGSANVFVNGLAAARAHVDKAECSKHPKPPKVLATGSGNVYVNGMPAVRVGDKTACSADVTDGSANVYIGGGTQQTDEIAPEDLVPGWVHAALLVVGVGSAVVLAGPIVAAFGLAGGLGGGALGGWAGGKLFGEGSDGQKWSMLAGSLAGGWAGVKGGQGLANRAIPMPLSDRQGFVKGGLPGVKEAANNRLAVARNVAEERANQINQAAKTDFPNGRKPLKTSAVVDRRTGRVYQDDSGYPHHENIHPKIQSRIPDPSKEKWVPQNCAEFKAVNKALRDGARIDDLEIYTVDSKTLAPAHRCKNCLVTTRGAKVFTDLLESSHE